MLVVRSACAYSQVSDSFGSGVDLCVGVWVMYYHAGVGISMQVSVPSWECRYQCVSAYIFVSPCMAVSVWA